MNSFQIHNSNGEPIDIHELDKEAAEFWNKPVHNKQYAFPIPEPNYEGMTDKEKMKAEFDYCCKQSGNWYDTVGYQIANPKVSWTNGWDNIKACLWAVQSVDLYKDLFDIRRYKDEYGVYHTHTDILIAVIKSYLEPYYNLIDHWASKGYIPVQIKE